VEKTISSCIELRERLTNIKRKKRNRITFVVAYCIVAGIVMSQFLIVGFTFWMFIALIFISALIINYRAKEAQVIQNIKKLGCEN
jgi:hypothetical protein